MPHIITSNCISCVSVAEPSVPRCQSICPTNAIRIEGETKWIDKALCNNCVGFYSVPQCAAVCPATRGCIPVLGNFSNTTNGDYWELWSKTHDRLVARLQKAKHTQYWEQWFSAYSQKLAHSFSGSDVGASQIQSHKLATVGVQS